jgi:hypothetical protein
MTWFRNDLAAHPSGLKFAVFNFSLYSDAKGHGSDPFLNATQGPESIENVLAKAETKFVFNGHANIYERNVPSSTTGIVGYVTGGDGAPLGPVGTVSHVRRVRDRLESEPRHRLGVRVGAEAVLARGSVSPPSRGRHHDGDHLGRDGRWDGLRYADLQRLRGTPIGAGEGNRTPVSSLGSLRSAIEPRPRVESESSYPLIKSLPDAGMHSHRTSRGGDRHPAQGAALRKNISSAGSVFGRPSTGKGKRLPATHGGERWVW